MEGGEGGGLELGGGGGGLALSGGGEAELEGSELGGGEFLLGGGEFSLGGGVRIESALD